MQFRTCCVRSLGLLLALAWPSALQAALPHVQLRPVWTNLNISRPLWMEEAPGAPRRFFVMEQQGRVLLVPRDGDGSDATEFLNIVSRKPFIENEEGLLGFAPHPQFASNGRFYILYTQQNPKRSVIAEWKTAAN